MYYNGAAAGSGDSFAWFPVTLVEATGNQSLTQSSIHANTNTFYTHSLAVGAVALTQSAIHANTNTFYTHSLAATIALTQSARHDNTNTFYTHSLAVGPANLTQTARFDNSATFYTHTLSTSIALTQSAIHENSNTFYTHSLAVGPAALTQTTRHDNSNTFYAHSLATGAVALTQTNVHANENTFYTHVLTQGALEAEVRATFSNLQDWRRQLSKLDLVGSLLCTTLAVVVASLPFPSEAVAISSAPTAYPPAVVAQQQSTNQKLFPAPIPIGERVEPKTPEQKPVAVVYNPVTNTLLLSPKPADNPPTWNVSGPRQIGSVPPQSTSQKLFPPELPRGNQNYINPANRPSVPSAILPQATDIKLYPTPLPGGLNVQIEQVKKPNQLGTVEPQSTAEYLYPPPLPAGRSTLPVQVQPNKQPVVDFSGSSVVYKEVVSTAPPFISIAFETVQRQSINQILLPGRGVDAVPYVAPAGPLPIGLNAPTFQVQYRSIPNDWTIQNPTINILDFGAIASAQSEWPPTPVPKRDVVNTSQSTNSKLLSLPTFHKTTIEIVQQRRDILQGTEYSQSLALGLPYVPDPYPSGVHKSDVPNAITYKTKFEASWNWPIPQGLMPVYVPPTFTGDIKYDIATGRMVKVLTNKIVISF
jgi:hypothetical protein